MEVRIGRASPVMILAEDPLCAEIRGREMIRPSPLATWA